MLHLFWVFVIGFAAGFIAKLISPGNNPSGFFVTAALGIAGSLAAKFLGEMLHWYRPGQSAGFIGSIAGAISLLAIYHFIERKTVAQ